MPNLRFTQSAIDVLKAPSEGRVYYWDSSTPGFGIRISCQGKRTWVTQYRVNGKPQMETIGPLSDIPSVKMARERAQKSRQDAREGKNPHAEKRAQKEVQKQQITVRDAAERYLRLYCARRLRPNTLKETERMFAHDIFPHWGKRPLSEITKRDVKTLLERKATTRELPRNGSKGGSGVQANRNLTKLKTFFRWCVDEEEFITVNPAIGVGRLVEEEERERVLEDDEIVALWHATERLGFPYQQITRLLLLTGQRRSEVSGLRRSELKLERREWVIPRERAKNNKTHVVHLSPLALSIIESLPNLGGDLLFSLNGSTPVSGFPHIKTKLDVMMSDLLGCKVTHWTFHDLRRTAATGMAAIDVPHHVLDKILNHVSGAIDGIAKIYNRHEYLTERRDALDSWAQHVEKLVKGKIKRAVLA